MEDTFAAALARATRGGTDDVDAAASVLAAEADWDAVARSAADDVVRDCARRGWQPQDLLRMAGRELEPPHQRLAAALPEPGLGAFARTERLDRFSAATAYVELLRLYARLPAIPALAVEAGEEAAPPKMLARIRALLAKAESTGYPEEAEALSAKAQHLMARHSIDAALLAASHDTRATAGARRIGVDRPYEGAKALLLDAVAAANRCQSVWSSELGFSTVVGHAPDLDAVELLYTSLLVQADRALHGGRTSRSRDFRESFLIAYASRIRARLLTATAEEESETPDLLPALTSRALAVEDTTRRLFPTTTTSRLRARDADGWHHGESAADTAHLRGARHRP
ncbi:DUF2786 domain-containing protein [Actinacidiphila paucisporea]|uniref:DUF2786 domain-containing protein n=1 Tax=Actinacidiphila paucisporea TaxID=310782 RepID=A0A1M7HWM3_9ACTN|nr:DUF2786 domain-containing protein [Actinacidiphila paucisporea]SHM32875.1 Protein of unknown function [Actinacidiphila paucisporea]